MAELMSAKAVRVGAVRGRYFRENFAQGGIDLTQIVPELVTNADAAIAASSRAGGRIELRFGAPDAALLAAWRSQMRALRVPALLSWRFEVSCADDGIGIDAAAVDRRLGALGELPEQGGQRGLFGRGLRDVWLAHGAGRIEGVRDGREVESWFFPAAGDDPYAYLHVRDEPARRERSSYTRVSVPLSLERLPAEGRLRSLVSQLVQIRPVLEDPERQLWLELPSGTVEIVRMPVPEPDPERPVLFDEQLEVSHGVCAQITVRRSAKPLPPGASRATRLGGLVVRSGRAAHESTLAGLEGAPGTRHLFGEVRCDALEELQRAALQRPRPQVVVRVDRSGLNENHPVVKALYATIERVLRPIVAAEERRAGAHLVRPAGALRARDQVGLRALNDALKNAFDTPGKAGFEAGGQASTKPPTVADDEEPGETADDNEDGEIDRGEPAAESPPLRFKQALVRLHPGERRGVSLLIDPQRIAPGTQVHAVVDPGLGINLWTDVVPERNRGGWSRIDANLRCRVSAEPGARLSVLAEAGGATAELVVLVVRHHASGWVREIARKDEDAEIEAHFDPETGVVTVFEGRREFKALERAARRAGLAKARVREYLPYRMLEVEVAANTLYAWAAEEILARRLAEERPSEPADYAAAVRREAQALRYRAHEKLMRAFLDDAVYDGRVRVAPDAPSVSLQQTLIAD